MHIVHVIHVFMLEGLHKNGTEIAFEKETFATMLSIEVSHACAWKKCLCPHVSQNKAWSNPLSLLVKFCHHWQPFLTKKFSVERFRFLMDHDSFSSGYSEVCWWIFFFYKVNHSWLVPSELEAFQLYTSRPIVATTFEQQWMGVCHTVLQISLRTRGPKHIASAWQECSGTRVAAALPLEAEAP